MSSRIALVHKQRFQPSVTCFCIWFLRFTNSFNTALKSKHFTKKEEVTRLEAAFGLCSFCHAKLKHQLWHAAVSPPAYHHLSLAAFPEAAMQVAHMVQKAFRIYLFYESRTMSPVYIWKKKKKQNNHTQKKKTSKKTNPKQKKPIRLTPVLSNLLLTLHWLFINTVLHHVRLVS